MNFYYKYKFLYIYNIYIMDNLSQLKNSIRLKNLQPPKLIKSKNNNNIIFIILLLLLLAYIYKDKLFTIDLRLPHSKNEDELKFIPKSNKNEIVGVEPYSEQTLYNLLDESKKDFYTVSEVIKPEYYFKNNKDIKIKNFKDNCKVYKNIKDEPIYYDCLSDDSVYNIESNDKYIVNDYLNDKIENGSEFYIGNDLIKGYENAGLMSTL